MNKLEELIKEFCPNGVDYKKLNEVCTFNRGTSITSKDANEGNIPVISGGQKPAFYHNVSNRPANTITVAGSGAYAGYVAIWDKPIFCADSFSVDIINEEQLNKRYLYHYLLSKQSEIFAKKQGAGIPHVHGKDIASLKIQLPALPVQREIVRILDSFTLYSAELTAELTARRKQYEFYRDKLLNFNSTKIEWKTLKETCDIVDYRGKTPQKVDKGIFLVTAKNIKKGYIDYETSKEYVAKEDYVEVMHRGIPEIGDVIFTTEAPCGNVAQIDNRNVALAQRVIKYRPKNNKLNSTFLKYYLLSKNFQSVLHTKTTGGTVEGIKGSVLHQLHISDYILIVDIQSEYNLKYVFYYLEKIRLNKFAKGGGQPLITATQLKEIVLSLPPLEKQKEIVDILDRFDNLCNDLSAGLPAEIEHRQKQYEYYRDKLLRF